MSISISPILNEVNFFLFFFYLQNVKKAKKEDVKGLDVAASVSVETRYSKAVSNTNAETTSKNELIPESELVNFSTTVDRRSHTLVTRSTSNQRIRTSKKPLPPKTVMPKGMPSA